VIGILRITKGKRQGEAIALNEGSRLVVGRDISSDIQMFDPGLSRTHMLIEVGPDSVQLTDLNSSNGTFVNGNRITKTVLNIGDVITVGDVQLRLEESPQAVCEDPLADMVQDLFGTSAAGSQIKKRFQTSDSGLLDLAELEEKSATSAEIAKNLEAIYQVSAVINTTEDLNSIFNTLMDTIYNVFEADRSYLIMLNAEKNTLEPVVVRKSPKERSSDRRINISTNIVKESVKNGLSVLSSDAMQDERFKTGDSIIANHIRSVMCVPVESREKILGAIYVDSVSYSNVFNEDDLHLLTAIGKQAGVAIRRAKLIEDLEQLYTGLVQALVATIEAKDQYTKGHSERVTFYAVELAKAMRLSADIIDNIKLGGLLHDVGKISIPERVLNKPGKLDEAEWELIRRHPKVGAQILSNIANIDEVINLVRYHHERFDGCGYPYGLKGEDVPVGARILAVADTFDAMTSKRPYRDELPLDVVIQEIKTNMGAQFDRKIAEVFLWMLEKGKISPDSAKEAVKPEIKPEK
jgi:putative nucleotidyltransferase with HDIG domain